MGLCLSQLELFFLSPYVAYYRALLLVNISMAPCRGARATHWQLGDWNCAWSPICHAKMVLFPWVIFDNAERLWEAGSWWLLAQRFFHRYHSLKKGGRLATRLSEFFSLYGVITVIITVIIKQLKHFHGSLLSRNLWDLSKDYSTITLVSQAMSLQFAVEIWRSKVIFFPALREQSW